MAMDPRMLDLLEKDNPDLVAAYRAKMAGTDEAVKSARDAQDYGSIANTIGSAATDYANGMKSDVVLHNRMDKLGSAPKVIEPEKREWDPSAINTATSQGLARATGDRDLKAAEFAQETKLQDLGMARSDAALKRGDDVITRAAKARSMNSASQESAQARDYLVSVAPEAANLPGFSTLTEEQAYRAAKGMMEQQNLREKIKQRQADSADKREAAAVQRELVQATRDNARDLKESQYQDSVRVEDADVKGGFRPTADDAKKAKDARAVYTKINGLVNEMDAIYTRSGTNIMGDDATKMANLETAIVMAQKELDALGVLNGRDETLTLQQIPTPTSFSENVKGIIDQDQYGAKRDQYRRNLDIQLDSTLDAAGYKRRNVKSSDGSGKSKPGWAK